MKRQPTEWEKKFANDVTSRELISNLYKQLIQVNISKTNKMDRSTEQTFSQRGKADGQQTHEKILHVASQHEFSPHTCQNGYLQKGHK